MNVFNPWMNTTKTFFPIIRAILPPPFPANCAPGKSPGIVSTSHQKFNNCRELIVGTLSCNKDNFTHVHVDKHHKNPQTILKNSKEQPRTTPK